jgi:hypothetical protein
LANRSIPETNGIKVPSAQPGKRDRKKPRTSPHILVAEQNASRIVPSQKFKFGHSLLNMGFLIPKHIQFS